MQNLEGLPFSELNKIITDAIRRQQGLHNALFYGTSKDRKGDRAKENKEMRLIAAAQKRRARANPNY